MTPETITPAEYRALASKRRRKYGNKPEVVDGHRFDSQKEAAHYRVLRERERLGEIEDLVLQPRFRLDVCGVHVCDYIGDFAFRCRQTGESEVHDVKGVRTSAYIIKRKLMKAVHSIEIVEI